MSLNFNETREKILHQERSQKTACFSGNRRKNENSTSFHWKEQLFEKHTPNIAVWSDYPSNTPLTTRHTVICSQGYCIREIVCWPHKISSYKSSRLHYIRQFIDKWHKEHYVHIYTYIYIHSYVRHVRYWWALVKYTCMLRRLFRRVLRNWTASSLFFYC